MATQEEINTIRGLLNELGRVQNVVEYDEFTVVASNNKIYLEFQNVIDVVGVWLATDNDKSGTNYYTGGSVDYNSGVITLGTPLAPNTEVVVTYVRSNGLTDEVIDVQFETAKAFINHVMCHEYEFDDPQTDLDKFAKKVAYNLAAFYCMLTLNMGNAVQTGFNYKLEEFEVQTKLWGEGMISQALFDMYIDNLNKLFHSLAQKTGEVTSVGQINYLDGYAFDRARYRRDLLRKGYSLYY